MISRPFQRLRRATLEPLRLIYGRSRLAADDHQLVEAWLTRALEREANSTLYAAMFLHVLIMILAVTIIPGYFTELILGIHGSYLAADLVALYVTRGRPGARRRFLLVSTCILPIAYGYLARQIFFHAPTFYMQLGLGQITGMLVACLIALPAGGKPLVATALLSIAATFAASIGLAGHEGWLISHTLAMGGAAGFRAGAIAAHRRLATDEIRARLQLAPRQIVRHSLAEDVAPHELFPPRTCPCAFLSADQSTASPADLHAFHATCDRVLRDEVPDGTYFTDWIGSDLFIVFYTAPDGSPAAPVAAAVRVARALLAAQHAENGPTFGLGLAGGPAIVGTMGPPTARKVTAIGEAAGRARRLLGGAHLLNQWLGPKARFVLDEDTASLTPDLWLGRYPLLLAERLPDVATPALYYGDAATRAEVRHAA